MDVIIGKRCTTFDIVYAWRPLGLSVRALVMGRECALGTVLGPGLGTWLSPGLSYGAWDVDFVLGTGRDLVRGLGPCLGGQISTAPLNGGP